MLVADTKAELFIKLKTYESWNVYESHILKISKVLSDVAIFLLVKKHYTLNMHIKVPWMKFVSAGEVDLGVSGGWKQTG